MISKVSQTLYRGPLLQDEERTWLEALGISTIIWLESGTRDLFYPNREYLWDGFNFVQIACSDIFPPSDQAVDRFLHAVKVGKSYVHCLRGKDRTGYMCAVYRMQFQGWSYQDAVNEMYDFGFNKWLYWWWKFKLKRWSK